jgi:large subunit ribosomal protein L9
MELILKNDVENLGFKDDIVNVKNGYGRNFLIPQGHAILATPSAKKVLAENLKQRAFKEKKLVDDANALAKKILAIDIKISAKAGGTGKLFGSIGNADLSTALKAAGFDIEKKFIKITGGMVKVLGKHRVQIRLHRDVKVQSEFEVIKSKDK